MRSFAEGKRGLEAAWTLRALVACLVGTIGSAAAIGGTSTQPPGVTIAIAAAEEALTFARVEVAGEHRVLLVQRYAGGTIEAIDLTTALGQPVADPLSVYREHGYDSLASLAARPSAASVVRLPASSLTIPLDLGSHHVAAGTNYPAHAGESGVEDGPFLFVKLVMPTPPRASVAVGRALLDYEVELAWVTLDDIEDGVAPAEMGVILCNDYTDRDTLLRHIDVDDVPSGTGFTTGKSRPGYLPVGDLFVIPRDHRAFAAARELHLDVNGEARQASLVSAQIWDIDRLLVETWARLDKRWQHGDGEVSLLAEDAVLPARTLVMSGTPAGTVFQGISLTHKLRGIAAWLVGRCDESITDCVIDAYTGDPTIRAGYLQAGDRVAIAVDYLGTITNQIVP